MTISILVLPSIHSNLLVLKKKMYGQAQQPDFSVLNIVRRDMA